MAEQFYYLVASLPELSFGEQPPFTQEEFLNRCRGVVSGQALDLLENVKLFHEDAGTGLEMLDQWHVRDNALRNALVRMRAQRLGIDPARWLRQDPVDMDAARAARLAMESGSPLEADELLDRARWRWLNELETLHFFDLERLVVYLLKLRIMERRKQFNRESGRNVLSEYQTSAADAGRLACAPGESSA